ncbi:MAG: hypothetical protein PHH26_07355 [Candidatus Thermoplasmatota archaeon]|jgi:hypothetical protein|nr:hypothetical protein [Candidatus Thermoplasmatota archaeon]
MTKAKQLANMAMGLACVCLVWSASVGMAANPDESARPVLDKLLKAVEANDYKSFVSDGADAFKTGITKEIFEGVSKQMAPRIKKGYTVFYLGELKQQGMSVYLWKLVYKDGENDTLAKLVLTGDKVAGVLFQ